MGICVVTFFTKLILLSFVFLFCKSYLFLDHLFSCNIVELLLAQISPNEQKYLNLNLANFSWTKVKNYSIKPLLYLNTVKSVIFKCCMFITNKFTASLYLIINFLNFLNQPDTNYRFIEACGANLICLMIEKWKVFKSRLFRKLKILKVSVFVIFMFVIL